MNIIRNTVVDLNKLMSESEELREQLVARGVQMQTINVLVEMGFHDRLSENDALISSALDSAQEAYGHGAISQDELIEQLDQLVGNEKDIAHCRRLAKQRGLDLQALNHLARLIRQNPGDGGEKAINTFLGYSQACEIKLSGIEQITQKYVSEPDSVLPQVQLPVEDVLRYRKILYRDVFIGLMLAAVMMALII